MPEMEPTPIDPGPYKPAVSAFLRCHLLRARRTPSPRPARHRGADLLDILYPASNTQGAAVRGFVESRRLRRSERPLYVRGTVRRHPVLLVGGDGSDPYPLGLAEHWAELRSVGRWVTRVACPCGQEPPCIHAQALYAQVVGVIEGRRRPPEPEDLFHVEVDLHA